MLKRQPTKKLTALKGPPTFKKAKKVFEAPPEIVEEEESEIESFDEDDEIDTENEEMMMEGIEDEDDEESEEDEFADMNAKAFVLADGKDDDKDSDKELEIALQAGLIDGKQFAMRAQKRELVNKVEDIKQKLSQMKSKDSWIKTVAVTASKDLTFEQDINNDFEREALFYKQAQDGARQALAKLKQLNIPFARPADYFAEMVKSDSHMHRVRNVLLNKQKEKDRRDTVRRLRTEKKFASKVQKETEQQQRSDKRKFLEAVKKHRKGMKGQLETMLNNARSMDMDDESGGASSSKPHRGGRVSGPGGKKKISRTARDKKYGFGGIKRGSKRNDKASFNDVGQSKKGFGGRRPKFGKKR